jgi:hypothetical protein
MMEYIITKEPTTTLELPSFPNGRQERFIIKFPAGWRQTMSSVNSAGESKLEFTFSETFKEKK